MAQLEFKAKSVKKAVAMASQELNISVADLDYQIKSYGSSGIFGLVGARKAKISVKIPSDIPDKPAQEPPSTEKPKQPQSRRKTKPDTDTVAPEPEPSKPKTPDSIESVPGENEKPAQPETEQFSLDEVAEHGQEFLKRLVDIITPDTTVSYTQKTNKISYDVTDGNPAILIGKHGQTLEALQYLTEKAVNRKIAQRILVEVDVAGYQAKRQENLIDQARRMADKAAKNKKPVTIGPMSPQDRRVVHLTLKSDTRVRTQSIGRGITRKLTIYPKKRNPQGKRKQK